jgi:hypothetical protein
MMTEDEARKKWCPQVRFVISDKFGLTFNNRINSQAELSAQQDGRPTASRCIASRCTAWRWIKPAQRKGRAVKHACGYCGLAGRP